MALQPEDAASVLEQFVQDVANLPAEIAHLLEEIQAKDRIIQECRTVVNTRDASIQKFLKANGAGQPNPKEETYIKNVTANFDKAQIIQEEKVGLSEKAATLLDRQIKRLDLKIRDLQNEGNISIDPQLPSLLNPSTHRLPSLSNSSTNASTPLASTLQNNPPATGPSTTIANNNPLSRLVAPSSSTPRNSSPVASAPTPNLASQAQQRSSSSDASKRRRLQNGHLSVPPAGSSALRQSSLGPNSPKPATQQASRGSSAGPRPSTKKPIRGTAPPHQRVSTLNPSRKLSASQTRARQRLNRKSGLSQNTKASASDRETSVSEVDGAGDIEDGDADGDIEMVEEEIEEGEGDDKQEYCTCRHVSYGNMVACDNDECPYEWFHWSCVGMTREPAGKWFCRECKEKLGIGN